MDLAADEEFAVRRLVVGYKLRLELVMTLYLDTMVAHSQNKDWEMHIYLRFATIEIVLVRFD